MFLLVSSPSLPSPLQYRSRQHRERKTCPLAATVAVLSALPARCCRKHGGSSRPTTQLQLFVVTPTHGFPDSSAGKESICNVGVLGLMPGLERSPGEGKAYPLQYSGLKNSTDCVVHGVAKSRTQLSDCHYQWRPPLLTGPPPQLSQRFLGS